MRSWTSLFVIIAVSLSIIGPVQAESIRGRIVDQAGKPVEGVMVSAIDDEHRKWVSVFSQKDGSFEITGLRNVGHKLRTRLMGM
ncbi:MAG: carboxypeptidase-like regulatory domain-containing protein, partial [Planctomycetota bacterium]